MASSKQDGKLRGNIDNLTYRVVEGKSIVQSRPGKGTVKQTAKTKESSLEFSLGSNRAKILREILFPMLRGMQDSTMVSRFTSAVGKVIRSNQSLKAGYRDLDDGELQLLNGFEFNLHSPFAKFFRGSLVMEQNSLEGINISLKGFKVDRAIAFPAQASGCVLRVLIAALDLKENKYQYCGAAELDIPVGLAAVPDTQWNFIDHLPENCLFVAASSLEFYEKGLLDTTSLNHKKLHPVALLGLVQGLVFEKKASDLEVDISSGWNVWLPVTGINGNQLRKG